MFPRLRRVAPLLAFLLLLPLLGACSLSSLLGLPEQQESKVNPWEKPRLYVKTLNDTLKDLADGFLQENASGRIGNAQYLDAEPKFKRARQALNDATAMLRSAETDRQLAEAALSEEKAAVYLLKARATEALAATRAAIAEEEIKLLRPVLERARGIDLPEVGKPIPLTQRRPASGFA